MSLPSKDEFPRPRSGSVVFVYNHQMMVWGGMTQIFIGEGDAQFMVDINLPGNSGVTEIWYPPPP